MLVRPYGGRIKPKNPYDSELAMSYAKKLPKEYLDQEILVGVYSATATFPPAMMERNKKITEQLAKIGLKIRFEANPEKFPTHEVTSKFMMKMSSKVVDLADPAVSYGAMSSWSPYKEENPSDDGAFDRAYEKALQATDMDVRFKEIQNISKLIEDEALTIPLLEKYALYKINPARVKTLGDQPKPLFLDLSKVEMK